MIESDKGPSSPGPLVFKKNGDINRVTNFLGTLRLADYDGVKKLGRYVDSEHGTAV